MYDLREQRLLSLRALISILFLTLLTGISAEAAEITKLEEVRSRLSRIEGLLKAAEDVREWERDGLNRRIDQLGLEAMLKLNSIAPELLASGDLDKIQQTEIVLLLDEVAMLALRREAFLEQRAATERELIPKFKQSAEADIARAFMEDLMQIRESYLVAFVTQAEIRRAAGLKSEALFGQAQQRLALMLDTLTGQIQLDAMSLRELRSHLSGDPVDEDLKRAILLVDNKQSRNLDNLERLLGTSERLGIQTTEQRGLLLKERGQLGIELLNRNVFAHLWEEELTQLRESFLRNGPNFLFRVLIFLIILVLSWAAARLVKIPLRAFLYRNSANLSLLLRDVLITLSSTLVLITGLIIAMVIMGVSIGHVFAGLGVLSIILGLAVQDALGNLAAGAMILIGRPYDVDDHIQVAGVEGLVKRMNLLATTITTLDNQSLIVPNGKIWGDTIVNFTAHKVRRVDIKVSIAYAEESDRVESVLMDVLRNNQYVLKIPEPIVHVLGMEDSSVALMAKPWVRTEDYWHATWDLNRQIKKRLDAEGIEIPFPQRVVTLISSNRKSHKNIVDIESAE